VKSDVEPPEVKMSELLLSCAVAILIERKNEGWVVLLCYLPRDLCGDERTWLVHA